MCACACVHVCECVYVCDGFRIQVQVHECVCKVTIVLASLER